MELLSTSRLRERNPTLAIVHPLLASAPAARGVAQAIPVRLLAISGATHI